MKYVKIYDEKMIPCGVMDLNGNFPSSPSNKFVKAYDKIDKTAFFYALDKSKYYNEIVDVEQKVLIETVMTYFGFVINTVGGE